MRKCKNRCTKFCVWCVLAWAGLPIEHAAWEWVPGATAVLKAIHLHV
jgi:hypothetical protein